jgi:hypothetical protein
VILALAIAIVLVSYYKWYPRNKKDYLGILPDSSNSTAGRAWVSEPALGERMMQQKKRK